MTERRSNDAELRSWLRRGDPAGDRCELSPDQAGRMRRAMLDQAARAGGKAGPAVGRGWLPLSVAGAAAAVLAALLLFSPRPAPPLPAAPPAKTTADGATEDAPPPTRTIHFTTERGTRIVWTLDSEFRL